MTPGRRDFDDLPDHHQLLFSKNFGLQMFAVSPAFDNAQTVSFHIPHFNFGKTRFILVYKKQLTTPKNARDAITHFHDGELLLVFSF